MSIRSMLASGELSSKEAQFIIPTVQEMIDNYWDDINLDDANTFLLKDTTRADRMEKSVRARAHRAEVKQYKQKSIQDS